MKIEDFKKEATGLKKVQCLNEEVITELKQKNSSAIKTTDELRAALSLSFQNVTSLEKTICEFDIEIKNLNYQLISKDKKIQELETIKNEYNTFQNEHNNCEQIKIEAETLKENYSRLEDHCKLYVFLFL